MSDISPNLGYRNARAAIQFLVEVLGFEEEAVYTAGNADAIAHATLRWPGGGTVMIYSAGPGQNAVERLTTLAREDGGYPAFSVNIRTDHPDELFNRVKAKGARVVREPTDSPVGTRGFIIADPEGLYWSFGTSLPKLSKDAEGRWRTDR